jgi:predicted anti-sigma-YlaC factor YlaD
MTMECDVWRDALSALADGEEPGIDHRLVDAHRRACAPCRAFAVSIEGSRRRALVGEAVPMPDLSRRVSKLAAVADRASAWGLVRVLLLVVALEVIVLSVPALVASGEGRAVHDGRHLSAFSIAYGVALLVVAVRPARARTVLPVSIVLAGALLITAVVDLVEGNVPLLGEAVHIPEMISVLLVWLLARPGPRRSHAFGTGSDGVGLRLVDADAATDRGRSTG